MKTSENLPQTDLPQMELPLTQSAEGSRARISPSLEKAPVSLASGRDYGASTPVLLANFDPATSSWKTSQHCLVEGLATFSGSWPRSGTMRSGIAYRSETLARPTSEIVSGLWPTPCARDWRDCGAPSEMLRKSPSLGARLLAPTPRKSRGYTSYSTEGFAPSLTEWISGQRGRVNNGLKPNPSFVEWMMGFPIGWGVLKPAGTRFPPSSPNSSAAQSHKRKE